MNLAHCNTWVTKNISRSETGFRVIATHHRSFETYTNVSLGLEKRSIQQKNLDIVGYTVAILETGVDNPKILKLITGKTSEIANLLKEKNIIYLDNAIVMSTGKRNQLTGKVTKFLQAREFTIKIVNEKVKHLPLKSVKIRHLNSLKHPSYSQFIFDMNTGELLPFFKQLRIFNSAAKPRRMLNAIRKKEGRRI